MPAPDGTVWDWPHELQWVHGSRTVVNDHRRSGRALDGGGFNGSTVREPWLIAICASTHPPNNICFNGSTVREPWLIGPVLVDVRSQQARLQWVHGSRTVVNDRVREPDLDGRETASMGPRFENRG